MPSHVEPEFEGSRSSGKQPLVAAIAPQVHANQPTQSTAATDSHDGAVLPPDGVGAGTVWQLEEDEGDSLM